MTSQENIPHVLLEMVQRSVKVRHDTNRYKLAAVQMPKQCEQLAEKRQTTCANKTANKQNTLVGPGWQNNNKNNNTTAALNQKHGGPPTHEIMNTSRNKRKQIVCAEQPFTH